MLQVLLPQLYDGWTRRIPWLRFSSLLPRDSLGMLPFKKRINSSNLSLCHRSSLRHVRGTPIPVFAKNKPLVSVTPVRGIDMTHSIP